jgi:redox-sensitive bicupin YhaK (pirin superfamily)
MMGLDLHAKAAAETSLPLNPKFEYGLLVLDGSLTFEGDTITPGTLIYLGCGRQTLSLSMPKGARVFMIGGEPFEEEILVWWNFVARTREEILQASADWENGTRFGEVIGYQGGRLHAPDVLKLKK